MDFLCGETKKICKATESGDRVGGARSIEIEIISRIAPYPVKLLIFLLIICFFFFIRTAILWQRWIPSTEGGAPNFKSTGFDPSRYFCWKCITLIGTENTQNLLSVTRSMRARSYSNVPPVVQRLFLARVFRIENIPTEHYNTEFFFFFVNLNYIIEII